MAEAGAEADRSRLLIQASAWTIGINVVLTLARFFAALISGSAAVMADAANSGTDILASLAVLGGTRIASLPPDENHPYGHEKAESVAAKAVAILVFGAGLFTGIGALEALRRGGEAAPGLLAVWVTAGSILVKEALGRFLLRRSQTLRSEALAADAANQRSDVLASIAAILGVLGARLGVPALDPIAGIVVAALIVRMGILLYWQAVRSLMDTAPDPARLEAIQLAAWSVAGVLRLDGLKARVHGHRIFVDCKIGVAANLTVAEGHRIAGRVKAAVREAVAEVQEVLVHVNPYEIEVMPFGPDSLGEGIALPDPGYGIDPDQREESAPPTW